MRATSSDAAPRKRFGLLAGTLGSSDPTIGQTRLPPVFASIFLSATTITPNRFTFSRMPT
ncbi:MAG: hypothetical protein WCF33_00075 [Pseudonocardiaceae bacterium]